MTVTDLTEATAQKFPPLDDTACDRLLKLLGEAADLQYALGRLLDSDDRDNYSGALRELSLGLEMRLAKAMCLAQWGNEDRKVN